MSKKGQISEKRKRQVQYDAYCLANPGKDVSYEKFADRFRKEMKRKREKKAKKITHPDWVIDLAKEERHIRMCGLFDDYPLTSISGSHRRNHSRQGFEARYKADIGNYTELKKRVDDNRKLEEEKTRIEEQKSRFMEITVKDNAHQSSLWFFLGGLLVVFTAYLWQLFQ